MQNEIPLEVWIDMALEMLDAHDLATLVQVTTPLPWPVGAVFSAKRVLTQSELDWFAAQKLCVNLLVERHVIQSCDDLLKAPPIYRRQVGTYCLPITVARVIWTRNGELHRDDDEPAEVMPDQKYRAWWFRGERHRGNDLPAVEDGSGSQFWYMNGELHRDGDQPAFIHVQHDELGLAITRRWFRGGVEYFPWK